MSLAEKQQQFIARHLLIEDPQERLAALTARGRKWPAPLETERTEAHRVKGCVSRVWLTGAVENGRCHFQIAADSGLIQGLAALLCELYEEATPAEVAVVEPELWSALGLDRQLSPTRLHGLANVRRVIRELAERHLPAAAHAL